MKKSLISEAVLAAFALLAGLSPDVCIASAIPDVARPPGFQMVLSGYKALPVRLIKKFIVFDAELNGRPAVVAIMNGYPVSAVSPEYAAKLPQGARKDLYRVAFAVPHQLSGVADMEARDTAEISEHLGEKVDVLLGGDFFGACSVYIDFVGKVIMFGQRGAIKPGEGPSARIVTDADGNFEARVNGRPGLFGVNLGTSPDLTLFDEPPPGTSGGKDVAVTTGVKQIGAGAAFSLLARDVTFETGILDFTTDAVVQRQGSGKTKEAGFVGPGVFKNLKVIFDLRGDGIYIMR